jgi:hypothetical protein
MIIYSIYSHLRALTEKKVNGIVTYALTPL